MTTQQKTRQAAIRTSTNFMLIDGPSKDAIEAALFDRKPMPKRVTFVACEGPGFAPSEFESIIDSVGVDYGCGGAWDIKGGALEPKGSVTCRNWRAFEASFNTENRMGTFKYTQKGAEGV